MKLDDNKVTKPLSFQLGLEGHTERTSKISPEFLFCPNPECENRGSYGCGHDNKTICKEVATSK